MSAAFNFGKGNNRLQRFIENWLNIGLLLNKICLKKRTVDEQTKKVKAPLALSTEKGKFLQVIWMSSF